MKICTKCGAYNSDDKFFCVDCSEKLSESISQTEETQIKNKLNDKLEKYGNASEPFYVSIYDKLLGGASIIGMAFCLVVAFMGRFQGNTAAFVISVVCFALAAFELLFPEPAWQIEKIFLSVRVSDWENAEPSRSYNFFRRISSVVLLLFGYLIDIIFLRG